MARTFGEAPTIVPEPQPSAECEPRLTPGPGPRAWVDTCDTGGHLVTCWAGHRAVVATCTRCTLERSVPRCEAPKVDLAALLERELPAGLARCSGRATYGHRGLRQRTRGRYSCHRGRASGRPRGKLRVERNEVVLCGPIAHRGRRTCGHGRGSLAFVAKEQGAVSGGRRRVSRLPVKSGDFS